MFSSLKILNGSHSETDKNVSRVNPVLIQNDERQRRPILNLQRDNNTKKKYIYKQKGKRGGTFSKSIKRIFKSVKNTINPLNIKNVETQPEKYYELKGNNFYDIENDIILKSDDEYRVFKIRDETDTKEDIERAQIVYDPTVDDTGLYNGIYNSKGEKNTYKYQTIDFDKFLFYKKNGNSWKLIKNTKNDDFFYYQDGEIIKKTFKTDKDAFNETIKNSNSRKANTLRNVKTDVLKFLDDEYTEY